MLASSSPHSLLRTALCLILAGVCAALHVWKLAPALPSLQAELGLSLVAAGFLLSMVQFSGMTLGLIISLMADRIGLRRCILFGLGLSATVSMLGIWVHSAPVMLLFRAIEGCGFLMVVLPVPSLLRRLLPQSILSRVMGLWGSYIPIATLFVLIIGSWVISLSHWRVLWLLLAALTLAMMLLVWILVPPDSAPSMRAGAPAVLQSPAGGAIRLTLGSGKVWVVALTFGTYVAQWTAVVGFLPTIYAQAGVSGTWAGLLTGLVAGANVFGNLLAGQLQHRGVAPVRLMVTGFLAMMLSAFIAFGLQAPAVVQFAAVVMFSAIGGLIPASLFMLAVTVAPTPQTTTTTIGWVQQCSAFGQFSGPPVVAWVVNQAGGWQWTWLATWAFALTGIALVLALERTSSGAVTGSQRR